ncbi:MAG: nuclear transport factor 2 family protein [Pseudorhodoplanes sp.]|uniref:nuclear transport factor 2 family protein n=1 Tax=Pseudorhodoplanes sp. TaxID=1934341 RepID=UPI003D0ABF1B
MIADTETLAVARHAAGRAIPDWVADFFEAYLARDAGWLERILHDDIDWLLAGPADQFDHYGRRRDKESVIELITKIIPCYYYPTGFVFEHLIVEGDAAAGQVAAHGRLRARQRDTGRSLNFRFANFLRFESGKLVSFRGIPDTFDAVEQMVGHAVDVTRAIKTLSAFPGDLVADAEALHPRAPD